MRRIECWKIRVPVHRTIRADAWLRKSPLCRLNEIALNLANVHTFSKMRNSSFCKCKFLQCIALGNQAECKCRWRKHIYLHDLVAKCMLAKLKRGNQMKSFLSSLPSASWFPLFKLAAKLKRENQIKTKSIFIAMTSLPTACWPSNNLKKRKPAENQIFFIFTARLQSANLVNLKRGNHMKTKYLLSSSWSVIT